MKLPDRWWDGCSRGIVSAKFRKNRKGQDNVVLMLTCGHESRNSAKDHKDVRELVKFGYATERTVVCRQCVYLKAAADE